MAACHYNKYIEIGLLSGKKIFTNQKFYDFIKEIHPIVRHFLDITLEYWRNIDPTPQIVGHDFAWDSRRHGKWGTGIVMNIQHKKLVHV